LPSSIANRLILGFGAILALTIFVGLYGLSQIGDLRLSMSTILARDIAVMHLIDKVRDGQDALREIGDDNVVRLLARSTNHAVPGTPIGLADWRRQLDQADDDLATSAKEADDISKLAADPKRAAAWNDVRQALSIASREMRQVHSLSETQITAVGANDIDGVIGAEAALTGARKALGAAIDAAQTGLDTAIAAGQARVAHVYDDSRLSIVAALAGSIVLGIGVGFAIWRSIVKPLGSFLAVMDRIGRGDLSGAAAATGRDELGRLGKRLNSMADGLRQLAGQSYSTTENLNGAVAEIRASAQEQAASVEEQLAAVQETAATFDEITHTGTQIGKRAQEVIAAAQATAQTSAAGLQAVTETTRAMQAIGDQAGAVAENIIALSAKTQAVGEIITSVNDISERSHLLALNAAIAAAAAGESGRAFAVVASEMKLLADQAKEATNQARSILGDIQRGINSSVMLTEEAVKRAAAGQDRIEVTQQTLEGMTTQVKESVHTFQQIVAATNQQQLGIEQVVGALQNIRQASQQTAAGTRQLDSAAGNLANLSNRLLGLAATYKLH
jgi:methyl-accepting chemotaxis protein